MVSGADLLSALSAGGVTTVSGVPCSILTPVINRAISDPGVRYVAATQEGEAVAIAAGAWLGGGLGCAFTQNSGLGNMVNPLTSLLHPGRVPALLLVTWRGQPGVPDEPQHELMGRVTTDLLELMEVGWTLLPAEPGQLAAVLERCWALLEERQLPHALVMARDVVHPEPLHEEAPAERMAAVSRHPATVPPPTRSAALERLLGDLPPEAAVVSTTGKTSRELYELADREQHFYMVGAMGSASAVGLGVALHTERPVVVVDGDGAALMRMGTLAAVAAHGPPNLVHVVLDNGVHDSTGGQRTLSAAVDLPGVAAACGYARVESCSRLADFSAATAAALESPGPNLVHLRIQPGSPAQLGRPRVTPPEVARRFRAFVTGERTALETNRSTPWLAGTRSR
jgi:phosphonopyruvate decarboxylase